MTIIESVRNFIKGCPHLKDFDKAIGVEDLGAEAKAYSIITTPNVPTIKRYADGSAVKQFDFVFASREFSNGNIRENIENCGFYERFSEWLEECTRNSELPKMGEGKTARKITASTPGYMYDQDEKHAQYQIQCKLTYYKERKND